MIERGPMRLDADRLPLREREAQLPTTQHNIDAGGRKRAIRGSTAILRRLRPSLAGVAPRLLPSDFETRTRFGIWKDWPIGYDDLLPFYREAERVLEIAGRPHRLFPGSDAYPFAPPEPSAADRLLGPLLEPFGALPLARPAVRRGAYPHRSMMPRRPKSPRHSSGLPGSWFARPLRGQGPNRRCSPAQLAEPHQFDRVRGSPWSAHRDPRQPCRAGSQRNRERGALTALRPYGAGAGETAGRPAPPRRPSARTR